jgi:Ni2+-binding GTPase involved in maturation of urease and hydrogenase
MEKLELLKPSSLNGFCGNKYTIKCIEDILKKAKTNEKNIIGIIGPDGCGKTTLCHLLFKKYKYNVLEVGRDNLSNDDIKTVLNNFAKNNTIDSIMNKRQKIVFVDDIDILTNVDKLLLSKIIALNKLFTEKGIKMFITCNINDERKVHDNSKDIDIFKLYYPSFKDSYVYIMNVFDEQGVDYDSDVLLNICSKFRGNIRETVLNLSISSNELDSKHNERIFKDMNNFEVTKYILQGRAKWNDVEVMCRGDVGIIPHLMYENLPDELEANYKVAVRGKKGAQNTHVLDTYLKVNASFIDSFDFENSAFTSHDWTMLSYANYMKVHSIYNAINSIERKQTTKDVKYRFSQMVSKMSHKNIMNKKMKAISTSSNTSNNSIIMASDMHATCTTMNSTLKEDDIGKGKSKKTSKGKKVAIKDVVDKNVEFAFNEGASIVNTYQKYFG